MAFIAGMAVMLAILLPFLPRPSSTTMIVNPHTGMAMTASAQCLSCHAAAPATQAAKRTFLHWPQ
jgi:hypothetical protein